MEEGGEIAAAGIDAGTDWTGDSAGSGTWAGSNCSTCGTCGMERSVRSGDRSVGKLHDLQGVVFAEIMRFQMAVCGINSYLTTITHPFDRSGSDDVETFINQLSGSNGAWYRR